MNKTIFITATDTEVGKTTVSAALAKLAKESGINVAYFKPVETGCENKCMDAKFLSKITGQPYEEVVLYEFKNPVAPIVAEKEENRKISIEEINNHLKKLQQKYDFLIVEGAGGVAVPITEKGEKIYTYLDFALENRLETILVARASLGTLNHTYLTVEALKRRNIKIKGIILNKYPLRDTLSEKTNPFYIKKLTNIDVISICKEKPDFVEECSKKLKEFFEIFQYMV
ncbi:MAG: dethiobiotin synthase [Aquificae bacterium]|nr:dethiobiotin synthase [Aquificota bacterium]